MADTLVLLTYDLAEPPGLHIQFKEKMIKLGWAFDFLSKALPNTTCMLICDQSMSRESVVKGIEGDLYDVSFELKKLDPRFKIKKRMIIAMDFNHFTGSIIDIS